MIVTLPCEAGEESLGGSMEDPYILAMNTFVFYNKYFKGSRLTLEDVNGDKVIIGDKKEKGSKQLWTLEPNDSHPGCYYFVNQFYKKNNNYYTMADKKQDLIVWYKKYDDQLFKFVPSGNDDGYHYIYNCVHKNDKVTNKLSNDGKLIIAQTYYNMSLQLWKMVPRFRASLHTDIIYAYDNRRGARPVTKRISVKFGMTRTKPNMRIGNKISYKNAIKKTLLQAIPKYSDGSFRLSYFLTVLESRWEEYRKIQQLITFPAGQHCVVKQRRAFLDENIITNTGDVTLYSNVKKLCFY